MNRIPFTQNINCQTKFTVTFVLIRYFGCANNYMILKTA